VRLAGRAVFRGWGDSSPRAYVRRAGIRRFSKDLAFRDSNKCQSTYQRLAGMWSFFGIPEMGLGVKAHGTGHARGGVSSRILFSVLVSLPA